MGSFICMLLVWELYMGRASEYCTKTAYRAVCKTYSFPLKSIVAVWNDCVDVGCLIFTIYFVLTHFFIFSVNSCTTLGIMQIQPSSSDENSSIIGICWMCFKWVTALSFLVSHRLCMTRYTPNYVFFSFQILT